MRSAFRSDQPPKTSKIDPSHVVWPVCDHNDSYSPVYVIRDLPQYVAFKFQTSGAVRGSLCTSCGWTSGGWNTSAFDKQM